MAETQLPAYLQGTLAIRKASEIQIIPAIQRKPTDDRLRKLARDWDERKIGTVELARITDGEYRGRLHPTDGGTRVECQRQYGDPEFLFLCVEREMKFQQAAEDFLWKNGLSMKPSAFSRWAVGVRAGVEQALAVDAALKALGLAGSPNTSTYGNGEEGTFAAFAAAERIVTAAYKAHGDWATAGEHFRWSLGAGRQAYPQHGDKATAVGHDADLIQALSVIGLLNPEVTKQGETYDHLLHAVTTWLGKSAAKTRLFDAGSLMNPEHWRVATISATKNTGGSSSRGSQMARQIVLNHNQAFPRLTAPPATK